MCEQSGFIVTFTLLLLYIANVPLRSFLHIEEILQDERRQTLPLGIYLALQ